MKISQILFNVLDKETSILGKKTYSTYKSKLNIFTDYLISKGLNDMPITNFNRLNASDFIYNLKLHNSTKHAYKNTLKKMFNTLLLENIVTQNPFMAIKLSPRVATEQKRAFTKLEVDLIKQYCQKNNKNEMWLFFQIMYYCLLRPHKELRLLKVNEIDLDRGTILVLSEHAKNKKREFVTIPMQLKEILENWIKSKCLGKNDYLFRNIRGSHRSKRYFYDKSKEIFDALDFDSKELSLYSWKHTGVVSFYEATKNIVSLQRQLRHHNIEEVQSYLHSLGLIDNQSAKYDFPTL